MDDDSDDTNGDAVTLLTARWAALSTGKERTAVQRAVDLLPGALAPERIVSRSTALPRPSQRHRTRRGCILQAPAAAVSVSWFPDAGQDAAAGELHVARGGGRLAAGVGASRVGRDGRARASPAPRQPRD